MKKIVSTVIACCLMAMVSCSTIVAKSMEILEDNLDELGEELDELGEELDGLGEELDGLGDSICYASEGSDGNDSRREYKVSGKRITISGSQIEISKKDKYRTRKFKINNYNALNVGYSFRVIMCDTIDSVTIRINEKLDKYLNVNVKRGVLNITLDVVGSIKAVDNAMFGYIYLPYNVNLSAFNLSGMASFATALPINSSAVDVDLSGASSFKGKITCTTFTSDLSGTSRCRADIRCQTADIELSGASRQESNIECKRLDADLSGTSKLKGNVKADEIGGELSGASTMQLAGSCDRLTAELAGTSRLDCKMLHTKKMLGDMSGASRAEISCSDRIEMVLSGTSHLIYYGNAKSDIEASRATTVERR